MAVAAGAASVGRAFVGRDFAFAEASVGDGPYGSLLAADANGIQLPAGFSSRVVAVSGTTVDNSSYVWHEAPDGGACFPKNGDGWVYVSNSEVAGGGGGVGVIEFSPSGAVIGGYRILSGTNRNCAGGHTPWYTWLSCEESGAGGRVHECDPLRGGNGTVRPALGSFNHEAAVVDPQTSRVYLTEDDPSGRLYRFTPTTPGDLTSGQLEAADVSAGIVTWRATSPNQPDRQTTTTAFDGGEGEWVHGRSLFFTTKGNSRVYEYGLDDQRLTILYDAAAVTNAPLTGVDNITAHPASGDLFVAEDGGNMELCLIAWHDGVREVAPFLRITGHSGSEVTGPAFSPDGRRLYLSSQRGTNGVGVTFEITGPFRVSIDGSVPPPPPTTTTTTTTTTAVPTTTSTTTTTTTTVPTNQGPTASFSSTEDLLRVEFDATASSDPDGSVTGWDWDFGDGSTGSGATVEHTYTSAGSYVVQLTVTDDDGATDSTTGLVTATGAATGPARDTFSRTVSGGLGTADVGGAWQISGNSAHFAVAGGAGRITIPSPGTGRSASLTEVSARDVDAKVDFSLESAPDAGGGYYSLLVRENGTSGYGVRLRARSSGTYVQLLRRINGGVTTLSTASVPGLVLAPDDVVHVRLQATGSPVTMLRGMIWLNADPVPTTWLLEVTDSTSSLQGAGGVGVLAYQSSSSSGSAVLVVDELLVDNA